MIIFVYDALFGYITFLHLEEHFVIKKENKKGADNHGEDYRKRCGVTKLFKRFSHLLSRHTVSIKSMSTYLSGFYKYIRKTSNSSKSTETQLKYEWTLIYSINRL